MSASLVGSEMCIRDRPHGVVFLSPPAPATSTDASPGTGSNPTSTNARSVSYTHLTLPTICSV
eukprot:13071939-Alexandrium_andersonii.AAC.1